MKRFNLILLAIVAYPAAFVFRLLTSPIFAFRDIRNAYVRTKEAHELQEVLEEASKGIIEKIQNSELDRDNCEAYDECDLSIKKPREEKKGTDEKRTEDRSDAIAFNLQEKRKENSGPNPKSLKKLGKFNLISEDECDLPNCNCGWNLQIGGEDPKDFPIIKKYLENYDRANRNIV